MGAIRAAVRRTRAKSGTPPKCFTKPKRTPRTQGAKRGIVEAFINQGHPAPAPITPRNAIQHGTIISLIDGGLHNHRAVHAKPLMQGHQIIAGAFRWRIGSTLGQREAIKRPPDMHMRIASAARQNKGRFAHHRHHYPICLSGCLTPALHGKCEGQTRPAGAATAPCIRRRALR
jgi:hypothetical protein